MKGKAVLLQAWSGPVGSRKLRFPNFMTTAQDGSKVVSLTYQPPLPPGKTPGTHFCQRLSLPQGHSATRRITSLKNSNDTIGNQTRDLPVCSVVHTTVYYLSEITTHHTTVCHLIKPVNCNRVLQSCSFVQFCAPSCISHAPQFL